MKIILAIAICCVINLMQVSAQSTELKIGDIAPTIEANDYNGKFVSSLELTSDEYLALIFYRGNWCPYCVKHLSELAESFETLKAADINVVLVTPENSKGVHETVEASKISYAIIPDTTYEILDAYQSKFKISEETVPKYLAVVTKRTRKANGNEEDILTVPATFVLNPKHEIIWMHYNKDYTERSKVDDILRAVETDKAQSKNY